MYMLLSCCAATYMQQPDEAKVQIRRSAKDQDFQGRELGK
jgi:hypothetical protein